MKQILLIIFTGTNNTLLVAQMIKDNFEQNNIKTDIVDITKPHEFDVDNYDVIGFGYPVYAFNPPIIFFKVCKKIKT